MHRIFKKYSVTELSSLSELLMARTHYVEQATHYEEPLEEPL